MTTKKTIKAKCPGCGVILEVTNINNEPQRQIVCPNCGKNLLVPFYKLQDAPAQQSGAGDGRAQQPTKPQAEEYHTQLGEYKPASQQHTQRCALTCNGMKYPLKMGANRVGRMAQTQKADVPIQTTDMYMSREHVIINVADVNGVIKADIANYKNKNATLVNGVPLKAGDSIFLHHGDRIQMGDTTMIFVIEAGTPS